MDPFSITASTITLLEAIGAIGKLIKKCREAHTELQVVLDELSDFNNLVTQSRNVVDEHGSSIPERQRKDLSKLLDRAKDDFTALRKLLDDHIIRIDANGLVKVSRLGLLRQESRMKALQNALKNTKVNLGALLTTITMSCSIKVTLSLEELSKATASLQIIQTSFQEQTRQSLAVQEALLKQLVGQLDLKKTERPKLVPNNQDTSTKLTVLDACPRCNFLRQRNIKASCLGCSRSKTGTGYKAQPVLRIDLLAKKLLIPGTYLGNDYSYLDDIITSWSHDTVPIFVKTLPYVNASLELRVRRFKPSRRWQPYVHGNIFDDQQGWIEVPPVRTEPFAVPYTHYVESGRLELWARESYREKMERKSASPGRALLSAVGLYDYSGLEEQKLVKNGFTFAALGWISTSILYASQRPKRTGSRSRARPSDIIAAAASNSDDSEEDSEEDSKDPDNAAPSTRGIFANDHFNSLSSCPTAINCQISLLAYERAREIEHDIFARIQKLMVDKDRPTLDFETYLAIYCTLTLMVDAYESFAFSFVYQEEQFQRCIHLVEFLTSHLHRFLRQQKLIDYLDKHLSDPECGDLASTLAYEMTWDGNREFFERHSWAKAKATDFQELNFSFQSLLQGFG